MDRNLIFRCLSFLIGGVLKLSTGSAKQVRQRPLLSVGWLVDQSKFSEKLLFNSPLSEHFFSSSPFNIPFTPFPFFQLSFPSFLLLKLSFLSFYQDPSSFTFSAASSFFFYPSSCFSCTSSPKYCTSIWLTLFLSFLILSGSAGLTMLCGQAIDLTFSSYRKLILRTSLSQRKKK